MSECPICFELIDESQYAIINSEGETSKYHLEHLIEWFTTHKTGILTQSPIETYSVFENGQHTETINVKSHYSSFKVFMDDINRSSETYINEEDFDDYELTYCCFW